MSRGSSPSSGCQPCCAASGVREGILRDNCSSGRQDKGAGLVESEASGGGEGKNMCYVLI